MVGLSLGFSFVNLGVESFSSCLPETGSYNLVFVNDKANSDWFLFYWELTLL